LAEGGSNRERKEPELKVRAKLSAANAQAIMRDDRPATVIAQDYGVSRDCVFKIKRGEMHKLATRGMTAAYRRAGRGA